MVSNVKIKGIQEKDSNLLPTIYDYVRCLKSKKLKGIMGNFSVFTGAPCMLTKNKNINHGIANGIYCYLVIYLSNIIPKLIIIKKRIS